MSPPGDLGLLPMGFTHRGGAGNPSQQRAMLEGGNSSPPPAEEAGTKVVGA